MGVVVSGARWVYPFIITITFWCKLAKRANFNYSSFSCSIFLSPKYGVRTFMRYGAVSLLWRPHSKQSYKYSTELLLNGSHQSNKCLLKFRNGRREKCNSNNKFEIYEFYIEIVFNENWKRVNQGSNHCSRQK